MARKIQIKRGNKSKLPTLAQGELALTLDEQGLWAGGSSGNIPIGGKAITPALIGAATTAQVNSAATAASNAATAASNAATAAAAAQSAANAAVKKTGDFMSGSLHATAFGIQGNNEYTALMVDTDHKGGRLMSSDDTAEGCALIVSRGDGLLFEVGGKEYEVYHEGNRPDIYVQDGDVYGTLVAEGYDAPGGGIAYRVRLFMNDDYLNGCGIILYPSRGVYIMDSGGNEHEVIHSGNISRYIG